MHRPVSIRRFESLTVSIVSKRKCPIKDASYHLLPRNTHAIGGNDVPDGRRRGRDGGVKSQGEAPEVVGVAFGGTGRDDGDFAFGSGDAFGFAQVVAKERV